MPHVPNILLVVHLGRAAAVEAACVFVEIVESSSYPVYYNGLLCVLLFFVGILRGESLAGPGGSFI